MLDRVTARSHEFLVLALAGPHGPNYASYRLLTDMYIS
jgi:hypothetical protein